MVEYGVGSDPRRASFLRLGRLLVQQPPPPPEGGAGCHAPAVPVQKYLPGGVAEAVAQPQAVVIIHSHGEAPGNSSILQVGDCPSSSQRRDHDGVQDIAQL